MHREVGSTYHFTVRVMCQEFKYNASKLQQTAATNSWLFCSTCGCRFGAEADTRLMHNIEPR